MTNQKVRDILNKLFAKACPYCAKGWPISDGDDGVDRKGRYHIEECQYSPGKFGGGFVECRAADERTALLAADAASPASGGEWRATFWVVERFENDKSIGYWDGGHSRAFVTDIDKAVQFCRRQDAMWTIVGWHWKDVQITEHAMLASPSP